MIIVWLSSTNILEKVRAGGFFFFFFPNQSQIFKLHMELLAFISPNKGANKSTLPKNIFVQDLNQY